MGVGRGEVVGYEGAGGVRVVNFKVPKLIIDFFYKLMIGALKTRFKLKF